MLISPGKPASVSLESCISGVNQYVAEDDYPEEEMISIFEDRIDTGRLVTMYAIDNEYGRSNSGNKWQECQAGIYLNRYPFVLLHTQTTNLGPIVYPTVSTTAYHVLIPRHVTQGASDATSAGLRGSRD